MARAVIQHIINKRFVRESKDIIEIALGILRVASRMRSAENGDGTAGAEEGAQRIGKLCGLSESSDEDKVHISWQFVFEIFEPGVADIRDFMPLLFSPHRDHLRHDTGKVGIHDARPERAGRPLVHKINDAYVQSFHEIPLQLKFHGGHISLLPPPSMSQRTEEPT